jgi:hypothetical protein
MNKILYLHGFNSSPDSHKARVLHDYMKRTGLSDRIDIPEIPPVPADAIQLLQQHAEEIIKRYTLSLVGSSLGGFYATWLAEKYNCTAVLINPAVKPHELLRKYLGENINYYTDESWVFDEEHIRQFRELYIDKVSNPQRYLLMLQTGDETLDYRHAVSYYQNCPQMVEQGGSHRFENFEKHLPRVLEFLELAPEFHLN